jgi:hypothetical protein
MKFKTPVSNQRNKFAIIWMAAGKPLAWCGEGWVRQGERGQRFGLRIKTYRLKTDAAIAVAALRDDEYTGLRVIDLSV